jgi:hypothetical protein
VHFCYTQGKKTEPQLTNLEIFKYITMGGVGGKVDTKEETAEMKKELFEEGGNVVRRLERGPRRDWLVALQLTNKS